MGNYMETLAKGPEDEPVSFVDMEAQRIEGTSTCLTNNTNPVKKVYLAGAFTMKGVMWQRMNRLESMGFQITHNWAEEALSSDPKDPVLESHRRHAVLDINGVTHADIVVACMDIPFYAYRGTWTEVGCAIGQKKRVILFMQQKFPNENLGNVFAFHPSVTMVASWEEAVEELKKARIQNETY